MDLYIMPYKISAFGLTDIGLVRHNNEDYWGVLEKLNFFVLADGMGGHRAGEIASKEAVYVLCRNVKNHFDFNKEIDLENSCRLLKLSIEETNQAIYKLSRADPELRGMGTTLCCIYFHPKGIVYGHVGDSRIYRLRSGKLEQLTQDHSLLRELVDLGVLNNRQASEFLYKNIITKAIGTESSVEPTVHLDEVRDQDMYLMCTDGLTDMLTISEIEKILKEQRVIEETGHHLVDEAKKKGGIDNITIVLMKVDETHERKDIPRQ